ncbi:riboflavin synthase [Metaclostridioides mangenotii]|uniref:riboflavin synthase n=1 Tax=Metaclostridioides mangenotii TaxID=1540 RepID=UPI0026E9DB7F|nr:riboflavin synthase [Clostridioides mangenotii]
MFTGIVEEIGTIKNIVKSRSSFKLTIKAKKVLTDIKLGDSIAVSGICLTAENISTTTFAADVMSETLARSSLNLLKQGDKVNLERAMPINGRFGGHIVSGHIDGVGTITGREEDGNAVWIKIKADENILKYVVLKGSIAIDGISLTIAHVDMESFKVSIIPHTMSQTTLLDKSVGNNVNLECDVVGKYIEKLIGFKSGSDAKESVSCKKTKIDEGFLKINGF